MPLLMLMKRVIHHVKKESKTFAKYALVGASGAVLDIGGFAILTTSFSFNEYAAATLSIGLAIITNYSLNRLWTFKCEHPDILKQFIKFVIVSLGALVLNLMIFGALLHLAASNLGIESSDLPNTFSVSAKIIATMLVAIYNFIVNRYWTFKPMVESSSETN